jgi:prepilin-type N-terminal cleavage/methylation domain-containing protein
MSRVNSSPHAPKSVARAGFHRSGFTARGRFHNPRGFTLIEVVVAIGILSVVILSVFMLVTVSAASFKDSDMRNTATNIANYAIEYIRSRNVTSDNPLGKTLTGDFPGLVDMKFDALKRAKSDTDSINIHPALPSDTYSTKSAAFYSSLQGYVSIGGTGATGNEDRNATYDSSTTDYYDKTTTATYVVQFPFTATDPRAIKNFTALSGYSSMIYTSSANRVDPSKPEYDPHYTGTKANTMAYRGFRILTQIVARKALATDPNHVQYYDVQVTVFWVLGNAEHSYSVATQITTYGG